MALLQPRITAGLTVGSSGRQNFQTMESGFWQKKPKDDHPNVKDNLKLEKPTCLGVSHTEIPKTDIVGLLGTSLEHVRRRPNFASKFLSEAIVAVQPVNESGADYAVTFSNATTVYVSAVLHTDKTRHEFKKLTALGGGKNLIKIVIDAGAAFKKKLERCILNLLNQLAYHSIALFGKPHQHKRLCKNGEMSTGYRRMNKFRQQFNRH